MPGSPQWSLSPRFPHQNSVCLVTEDFPCFYGFFL
jgi:hypothetical protein